MQNTQIKTDDQSHCSFLWSDHQLPLEKVWNQYLSLLIIYLQRLSSGNHSMTDLIPPFRSVEILICNISVCYTQITIHLSEPTSLQNDPAII